jgi:hypothetical protein
MERETDLVAGEDDAFGPPMLARNITIRIRDLGSGANYQ